MGEDSVKSQLDKELSEKIEETKSKIEFYKNKYDDTMKTIYALKIGIRNIYENIGCGTDKVEDPSMITESNMLAYLSAIEERTNEILQMYDLCKHKVNIKYIIGTWKAS